MDEKKLTPEHALEHLTASVRREIPDQDELRKIIVPNPQPEAVPRNFDALLRLKDQLLSQEIRIPRAEGWDTAGTRTRRNIREEYRLERQRRTESGISVREQILARRDLPDTASSPDGTVFISPDEFPYHVDEAGDAKHLDVWTIGEIGPVVPVETVARTIAAFLHSQNLGENDFLIYQNPPAAKSVPEVEHLHLFIRVKSPTGTEV